MIMRELIFSCNWGKYPEMAWSGTSLSLYKELEKYYRVSSFDINPKTPILFPLRCLEKLGIGRYDMVYMKYYNKLFSKRYRYNVDCKVMQLDECPNIKGIDSYIYQDLCVSFLLDIYENNKNLIPYLGFSNINKVYLQKRVKYQNEFYQNANRIFTMGKWLAEYMVAHCNIPKEKVYAVGGGINIDVSRIDYSQKTGNKILFVGRDFKRKGGDLVVKAFHILKSRVSDVKLYIAGSPKNPITKDDYIEGIYFLGEQNQEDLINLYNQCDIFCMPSRFEAYGLVFPEALSFGLPCIGRDAFSMCEFIQHGKNGYLVDSDNVEELADKMEMALRNEEMKHYVKSQRDWYIQNYSWENVVKHIIKLMQLS